MDSALTSWRAAADGEVNPFRGHYELGVEADSRLRVREAFNELIEAI